jgi:hypothetical protein
MTIVSTVELRNNFAALVDKVFAGEEVIIQYTKGRQVKLSAVVDDGDEQPPQGSSNAILNLINDPVLREKARKYKINNPEFDGSMEPRGEKELMRKMRYERDK